MCFQLLSKEEAVEILARIAIDGSPLVVEVSEDICFEDKKEERRWIDLGNIMIQKGAADYETAIQFGAYEWHIPGRDDLDCSIEKAFPFDNDQIAAQKKSDVIDRIKKAFHQGIQDIVRRLLLLLPTFDSDALFRMPLRRPTTILPDTSAIHQGAIDFVARFLSPMARIKVPAIVHMEVDNQNDNYFSIRGDKKKRKSDPVRSQALGKHLLSQGGQRTLLRLELHSDVEMDRGDLGADPLRGIIQPDSDAEDKNLNLTKVTKSFADRLIVETARRHRSQVRPDHPLILLTGDQGMARMAMAEGIRVFFFQARSTPDPTGKILTGTLFHPFTSKFYTVSLAEIIWELAVSFGGARIRNPNQDAYLELWALGGPEQLTWHPLHAKDDLIWGYYQPASSEQKQITSEIEVSKTAVKFAAKGYTFTPSRMLNLIEGLVDKSSLTHDEIRGILVAKTLSTSKRYVKFLQSGQFVSEVGDRIEANDDLKSLWRAIKELNISNIHKLLIAVPSYSNFCSSVHRARRLGLDSEDIPINKKPLLKYIALGEMAGAILSIPDEGIVATDNTPDVNDFVRFAIECYEQISHKADEWILTGEWLECLALQFAVHPVRARLLLNNAKRKGLLNFFLQGSTPDTRFQNHTMTVLELAEEKPELRKVFLYRGDFIQPGFAGVRIKIRKE